jgi:hypothetical protein
MNLCEAFERDANYFVAGGADIIYLDAIHQWHTELCKPAAFSKAAANLCSSKSYIKKNRSERLTY